MSGQVQAWSKIVKIPTYKIGIPDKNPMFLEKRVYQGSSGTVYPHPVIDLVLDEKEDKDIRCFQCWVASWVCGMIVERTSLRRDQAGLRLSSALAYLLIWLSTGDFPARYSPPRATLARSLPLPCKAVDKQTVT